MSAVFDDLGKVQLSRRSLLKGIGAFTGLALTVGVNGIVAAADAPKFGGDGMPGGLKDSALLFVSIGADGVVTIVAHRSEMARACVPACRWW